MLFRIRFFLIFVFILNVIIIIYPETNWANSVDHRGSSWDKLVVNGAFKKNSKWNYLLESELRLFLRDHHSFDQNINRAAIGYLWFPNTTLWLGYDYIFKKPLEDLIYEQRIWEQILYKKTFENKNTFINRSRLEQRKEENQTGIAWRFRQQFALEIPFNTKFPVTTVIYDELFFNLNRPVWVTPYTVDQNRVFLGIRFPFVPSTQLTVGYLNQYIWRTQHDTMNHIFYVMMGVNIA